jgi:hypothetical protein
VYDRSCEQNVGQSYNLNAVNKSFGIVAEFRYFGGTLTNQNCWSKLEGMITLGRREPRWDYKKIVRRYTVRGWTG